MQSPDELRREIEALRDRISKLSAAILRIRVSLARNSRHPAPVRPKFMRVAENRPHWLHQGFSTRQTADLLHVFRSNVTTRLHRATELLQKHIDARL